MPTRNDEIRDDIELGTPTEFTPVVFGGMLSDVRSLRERVASLERRSHAENVELRSMIESVKDTLTQQVGAKLDQLRSEVDRMHGQRAVAVAVVTVLSSAVSAVVSGALISAITK
jgi:hypothetical protein